MKPTTVIKNISKIIVSILTLENTPNKTQYKITMPQRNIIDGMYKVRNLCQCDVGYLAFNIGYSANIHNAKTDTTIIPIPM